MIILAENDIIHRDIRPENLLFFKNSNLYKLSLIDFGFATSIGYKDSVTPISLGSNYRYGERQFSDPYSGGLTLKKFYKKIDYAKIIFTELLTINDFQYNDKEKLISRLKQIKHLANTTDFSKRDIVYIHIKRLKAFLKK